MAKEKVLWSCKECGHNQPKWTGSCSSCGEWNSFIQEKQIQTEPRFSQPAEWTQKPLPVNEIKETTLQRISTQLPEIDRLLGGGLVPGSLTLIGGEPGIGKSTLMLQLAQKLAESNRKVFYICAEESVEQTSLRASRLNVCSSNLYLLSEALFSQIRLHIQNLLPEVLVVDSIQTLYKEEIPSCPGSVAQVRELATEFMHLSKKMGISTFLVGHITKSGEIAGPKVLEHLVDTVLDFEGDRQHGYRLLRSIKNRFGPTDDVAIFQMGQEGLKEVPNPSSIFLEERIQGAVGSVVIPTIEGTRAILVEVQALAVPSSFSTSSRKSTGLDQNRLALLLAVLEKKMGYPLHHHDVFVSVTGGLKIIEPAIDLGILLSIASSFCNRAIDSKTAVMGEVGLAGEVRAIPRLENRIREVIHMGFQRLFLPRRNLKGLPQEFFQKLDLQGVEFVDQAIELLIN